MSHQVQIDYKAIAIRCESICEVAEKQIAELDKMLANIESGSKTLMESQVVALKQTIEAERSSLAENINALRMRAEEVAKKGGRTGEGHRLG